ncbi:HAD-IA family hydrolase (plasmid) [Streptomyces sp. NBC_01591]|uniref:HAD family hydrolase n=1 Tax=Streptomyces sp. NBC_01591 TaxID=2975888 RepID=UPI002DDA63CC|nr:HAD-IA family hydrolase [Streptomyces sp. NBC_01591]WSD73887.1 HAD-IA family hydrolase [Streptomyces sp. NBC_01591]
MPVKGCMFDFSGTLFHLESPQDWLRAVLTEAGTDTAEDEIHHWAQRLREVGAVPGGPAPRQVDPALEQLWRERDLDAVRHRKAFTGLLHAAGLPWPHLADALYERHMTAPAWQPYPDTAEVLRTLHGAGIPIAVVSNIGWDLRPVFRAHGLDRFVEAYVLSFEHGVQKPDPELFRTALTLLGLDGADTAMVGDDRVADAGAAAVGAAVHFVDALPVSSRPGALLRLLPDLR